MKFIDSHCHLDNEKIKNEEFIRLVNEDFNLACVILQGANVVRSEEVVKWAKTTDKAFACVGVHPEDVELFNAETLEKLTNLAKEEKVVGIGEIGLDYHYASDNKKLQKEVFISQLKLASALNLPVCIHCRDAVDDLYEILKNNLSLIKSGAVIHCFCENASWAEKFVSLGCYISFCGNFTFKNYDKSVIRSVPLDKIMIETDSPFLAPVPHRGEINRPSNVLCVAEAIAKELNLTLDEVSKITLANTIKFYNLARFNLK